jgi:hypothetical protein
MKRYAKKYGRKVSWIVIRFGKYERKISWIVKRYGKYGRKGSWIVERYGKYGRQERLRHENITLSSIVINLCCKKKRTALTWLRIQVIFFHFFHIILLFNLRFFSVFHIFSLFNFPFFCISHIFSHFNLLFFHIFRIFSLFNLLFLKYLDALWPYDFATKNYSIF